jgi:hypothetical protein
VRTPVDEFGVHHLARSRSVGGGGACAPGEAEYGAVGFLPTTLPADPHTPWASSPSAPPLGLSSSTSSSNSHKDPNSFLEARSSRARSMGCSRPRAMRCSESQTRPRW